MAQEEGELHGKLKLVFEASLKIAQGRKLIEEGTLELESLMGGHTKGKLKPSKDLTAGQKSALTKKRKLLAPRVSSFKKDTRSDEVIKEKMIHMIVKNRQCSSALFMKKLKLSERRLNRCLGQLVGENKIEDKSGGAENVPRKWMFPETKTRAWTSKKKAINGHEFKAKKSEGGGGKKPRGGFIDVTAPKLVNGLKSLLSTDDWVTSGKAMDKIDVSAKVFNRLTDHMVKNKMIMQITKNHNPAHKHSPKNYERPLQYWALA